MKAIHNAQALNDFLFDRDDEDVVDLTTILGSGSCAKATRKMTTRPGSACPESARYPKAKPKPKQRPHLQPNRNPNVSPEMCNHIDEGYILYRIITLL